MNVIIMGASGAIGISLAKKYYLDGSNLYLFVRNNNQIKKLKVLFKIKGKQKIIFKLIDIRSKKSIKNLINKNKTIFRTCDILINTIGEQGEIKNFRHGYPSGLSQIQVVR